VRQPFVTGAAIWFGELAVSGSESGNAALVMPDNPGAQSLGVNAQQVRPKVCAPPACNKIAFVVLKKHAAN